MNNQKIVIKAGAWRPHFPWEHIAWIKPPWGSDDYIWLDLPEAIFTDQGLLYLSHINTQFPAQFSNLPPVTWEQYDNGIGYRRVLPNGISFSGALLVNRQSRVNLSLTITNGGQVPLTTIRLQTCLFMRAYYELSAYDLKNKFIHTADQGWINLEVAQRVKEGNGRYHLGWRSGPKIADLPVIVCQTDSGQQAVAFGWGAHTHSLVSNPDHPCIHADPAVPALAPEKSFELKGEIFFAQQGLEEIEAHFAKRSVS